MGEPKEPSFPEKYKVGRTLGTGSFATVKICTSREDPSIVRAVKIMDQAQMKIEDAEALKEEIRILKELEHPQIVKLHEVLWDKTKVYLVCELMSGGEMFDRIVAKEHYTEGMAKREIRMVAEGLLYCHKRNIVHRDLKPENLLYSDETDEAQVKIADFGLAKVVTEANNMKTACGTPGYVAPEILAGSPDGYNEKVDVWSLGVITYILLCGFPPFYHKNNRTLFQRIKKGEFSFPSPYWDNVSEDAKEFIKSMLVVDASKRISIAQVLENEWLLRDSVGSDLTKNLTNLKEFNAKRKFKQALTRVKSINWLKKMGGGGGAAAQGLPATAEPAVDTIAEA